MKTVFKEGQEVYDQVNFPDLKGKVIDVCNDESYEYPIGVLFENENGLHYYTPEGCFRKNYIPTLSTKPYKVELQGFEQKAPVRTYEEAVDWLEKNSKDRVIYADEAYINEEYERAFEALKKLTILRDYYNEGWQPDFNNRAVAKYCIQIYQGNLDPVEHALTFKVMHFKTEKIRDKFLEEQKELLEIAKPLL